MRRLACAVAVLALAVAAAARADWTLVEERFYALSLAGNPCGRSTERVERDGDRLRTVSRIEMRFSRLGQETAIDLSSEFVETERGDAVEATVRQKGAEPVRYVFETARKVRVERGAAREARELADADWLTPREAAAFIASRGAAEAGEIRFRTLDVQSGFSVVDISMKRRGAAERTVMGRVVRLAEYEVRNSLSPIVARDLHDSRGVLVESSTPLGLGELVSRLATREEADASYAKASFDLLAGTFVKSARIARHAERAELAFSVTATAGELIELPGDGAQRFTRTGPGAGRVTVELSRGSAAAPGDADDPRWRKSTELIDWDRGGRSAAWPTSPPRAPRPCARPSTGTFPTRTSRADSPPRASASAAAPATAPSTRCSSARCSARRESPRASRAASCTCPISRARVPDGAGISGRRRSSSQRAAADRCGRTSTRRSLEKAADITSRTSWLRRAISPAARPILRSHALSH